MKDIVGYEGIYAITSCGRVWSYRRKKFLTSFKTPEGYEQVWLCRNGKPIGRYVHRLVAQAYIPNPDNLPVINHKDEVPYHNWITNLEWCTQLYNIHYGNHHENMCKAVKQALQKKKELRTIYTSKT